METYIVIIIVIVVILLSGGVGFMFYRNKDKLFKKADNTNESNKTSTNTTTGGNATEGPQQLDAETNKTNNQDYEFF